MSFKTCPGPFLFKQFWVISLKFTLWPPIRVFPRKTRMITYFYEISAHVTHIDDNAIERLKKILQELSERRSRSSLEQMWSKLFNCCKTGITKKDVKSLTVNWSAQRTVASKHPPFGTDEYSQFSEFPKSFFLHRSWGHNYLWPSTSGLPECMTLPFCYITISNIFLILLKCILIHIW